MAHFNILRNADIRNDMSCRHDNNDGWAVVWDENDNFRQYDEVSGLSGRVVWDKNYVSVSTASSCYLGPSTPQTPFDAMQYSLISIYMRIERNPRTSIVPTTARIQFQTQDDPFYEPSKVMDFEIRADNAYNLYTIDMSLMKEWVGQVNRLRLYPFIDGTAGYIIHLKSIKVQSLNIFTCDTKFNGAICNKFSEYSHPCPWVGRGGSCSSVSVDDGIDILEGVNDKLVVNLNGYGNQGITLTPVLGARVKDVARDIEDKLSNVGIGGYAGVRVDPDFRHIKITADDTREASSTATVADTPLARTLGFYNDAGQPIFETTPGEDAATRYEPAGTIQLSKSQIAFLYKTDPDASDVGIDLNIGRYALRGGRDDYTFTYKEVKIDAFNKTLIDFNNPINQSGVISSVAFTGDGHSTTEFRIFRPKADGTITHLYSIPMSIPDGSIDKVYEKFVSLRVRKGDLLGVYNARVDSGKAEEVANRSYFLYDGNLKDGQSINAPMPIEGRGELGVRLFAHGFDKETECVLNIQFEQQELIEEVIIFAEEEVRAEEINLSHCKSGGLNGGIHITGSTGLDKFGLQAPGWVNLPLLFDTVTTNRLSVDQAKPAWMDTFFSPSDRYDQTELALIFDFVRGVPVFFNIYRAIFYFRDSNNVKYFGVEYPITTDDTDNQQYWGPVTGKYDEVWLEGKLLKPTDHPIYTNPIRPDIETWIDSYQVLEYHTVEFKWKPVAARSLRYNIKNFFYEPDVNKSTLSDFVLAPSPRFLEVEVFAISLPEASIADNFSFESSTDGTNYYMHDRIVDEGTTSARYLIGYPIQYLRARITPEGKLRVRNFEVTMSLDPTTVRAVGLEDVLSLNIPRQDYTDTQEITVVNTGKDTFNYFINISAQRNSVERCILWNRLSSPETSAVSEVGPSCSIRKREEYFPREFNYAYQAPAYVVDPFWLLNENAVSYISYDKGGVWEPRGTILTDYNGTTFLDAVNPLTPDVVDPGDDEHLFVYILIDLGKVYCLDTIQIFGVSGHNSFGDPLYSNKDVSDPYELNIIEDFEGVKEEARWIRFRSFSRTLEQAPTAEAISYIQASLNVVNLRNKLKVPWVPAPRLTNYEFGSTFNTSSCGEGWQCGEAGFNNWYAVDLGTNYRITNIILGPLGALPTADFDTVTTPGSFSAYSTTAKTNSAIGYSVSATADPKKVIWQPLNTPPGDTSRWILVRRLGGTNGVSGYLDEVFVHIEDNIQANKPVFNETRWWTSKYGTVVKDKQEFIEGTHSISVTYAKNLGPALEEMELTQSLGVDHELAKRDQLRLLFYVSDVNQLDFDQGYIALGRNTNETNTGMTPLATAVKDDVNFFKWPLQEIQGLITSGWNEVHLPFTDNFRVGRPTFEEDEPLRISQGTVSGRSRFRWFRVAFAGKDNNKEFDVKVGGMRIFRADYMPAKFGNGLYLSGNEYAKFSLYNFNIMEGTIEFWLNPDWSKDAGCNSCEDVRDHTIFRFFNLDGFVLGCFMTGKGLKVYVKNGARHYFLTDNSSDGLGAGAIVAGANNHVAITWDFLGRKSADGLRIYLNGKLSANLEAEAFEADTFKPNPDTTLVLGGLAWHGVIERRASSVDGTIENIKVYTYAKLDVSFGLTNPGIEHIRPSDDLIELSLDGVEFFGNEDRGRGLPLLNRNVAPGESFQVYVRRKNNPAELPKIGQETTVYLEVMKAFAG